MYEGIKKRKVGLTEYISGEYRREGDTAPKPIDEASDLATRRYTTTVDLNTSEKLDQLQRPSTSRLEIKFARDIRLNDLKDANVILLGAPEANPWVELFEPGMNFVFRNDFETHRFSILNRTPKSGEQTQYDSQRDDAQHAVFGILAFVPGINHTGNVLMVAGTSQSGTESVADFLFDNTRLSAFLHSIQRPDGSIPHFEVLLESSNKGGSASQASIRALRIEP